MQLKFHKTTAAQARRHFFVFKFKIHFDRQQKIPGGKVSFPEPCKAFVEMLSEAEHSFLHSCFFLKGSDLNPTQGPGLITEPCCSCGTRPGQASKEGFWDAPHHRKPPDARFSKCCVRPLLPPPARWVRWAKVPRPGEASKETSPRVCINSFRGLDSPSRQSPMTSRFFPNSLKLSSNSVPRRYTHTGGGERQVSGRECDARSRTH